MATTTTNDGHATRSLQGFDDSVLYKAFGESSGEIKQSDDARYKQIVKCDVQESAHYGEYVSFEECAHHLNRMVNHLDHDEDYAPWIAPIDEGFQTLATNPGIWVNENFLSDQESQELLDLVHKNGKEKGLLSRCNDPSRSHKDPFPVSGKTCFKISPQVMCSSVYDFSTCIHETEPEDGAIISKLRQKAQDALSEDLSLKTHVSVHVASPGSPPSKLHEDADDIMTFVVYLSDGGASTVFPAANVSITPKKGQAAMWLNVHKDGSVNTKTFHAVEAQPLDAGDRIIILIEFKRASTVGGWSEKKREQQSEESKLVLVQIHIR